MAFRNQPPPLQAPHRLVVKAQADMRSKGFTWIVRDTADRRSVVQETAPQSFSSMAAAYEEGAAAFRFYK
jgi:hypothetical protein